MKEPAQSYLPHRPLVEKRHVKVDRPSLSDTTGDWQRLTRALGETGVQAQPDLEVLAALGQLLRKHDWNVTATLGAAGANTQVLEVEPGDTTSRQFGLAADIGTTLVVAELVELRTGQVIGARSALNGQSPYGTDVTARMMHAEQSRELDELREAVRGTLNGLIEPLLEDAQVSSDEVFAAMLAGNTIMLHLFLGLDPSSIRREPYVPVTTSFPTLRAAQVGLAVHPRALVACVPAVSGYVGGDITAGVLSTGLADSEELSVLVDIGTNGETVLGNREWLVACSGSAGAAFEGCGLECGMTATEGAIERVSVSPEGDLVVQVIGGGRPRGICGSGLIDALAAFLEAGWIDRAGRISADAKTDRIRMGEAGREIVLAWDRDAEGGAELVLTQANIENLIRDKAALYAGSSVLLGRMGLSFGDVGRLLIAGGFGRHLDIEKAVTIGLLPDIPRERIQFIGNSSIAGARMALLSDAARNRADEIAHSITCFELTAEPTYYDRYVSALFLPHTDMALFPSVHARMGRG